MRQYETMFILRPEFDKEQSQEVAARFIRIIPDNGGTIQKISEWGKRRLAYEVKKYHEGIYILVEFTADAAVTKELERNFKISEDVIRYLIVRKDEE
ncbi:MAG: 30S ribosomal protein S6 [Bacillota bacterium]|jgi:small subunit ribosomal protein S6